MTRALIRLEMYPAPSRALRITVGEDVYAVDSAALREVMDRHAIGTPGYRVAQVREDES